MALEIERKYLVSNNSYRALSTEIHTIEQGYLSTDPERTVRVRILDNKGYITIKGITKGCRRKEFEYEIPYQDAVEIIELCEKPVLKKRRYIVPFDKHKWEIDEFEGDLYPLVLAEVELESENEKFAVPSFIGTEVTGNADYYNSNLIKGTIKNK